MKDSDIKGLRLVPFSLEVLWCLYAIGIDDSQPVLLLMCGEMTCGSRLERGLLGYRTYFLCLVSYLCTLPKRKDFFWDQSFKNCLQKFQDPHGTF